MRIELRAEQIYDQMTDTPQGFEEVLEKALEDGAAQKPLFQAFGAWLRRRDCRAEINKLFAVLETTASGMARGQAEEELKAALDAAEEERYLNNVV